MTTCDARGEILINRRSFGRGSSTTARPSGSPAAAEGIVTDSGEAPRPTFPPPDDNSSPARACDKDDGDGSVVGPVNWKDLINIK